MAPILASIFSKVTWIEIFMIICIAAILVMVVLGASKHRSYAEECRDRGGSWMSRENVCLRPEFAIPLGAK